MIIGIVAILTVFLGIYKMQYKEEQKETGIEPTFHWKNSLEVEVYSKAKVSDFVEVDNGKLEDKEINTEKLGEKKITFTYQDENGKKRKETFSVQVVDTTPPLVWISGVYTKVKGESENIEDSVLCGDNYDKKPVCKIEGSYNLNETGDYPLTYYAIDSSGNETKEPFTLRVIEKNNSSSSTSNPRKLEDIKKTYLTEQTEVGIDVSKWQAEIDWKKVKESGVTFAMIRLGTQKAPHEDSTLDAYFLQNIKQAQENGIKVGVYYYSYASNRKEAIKQADWVLTQLEGQELELPVVFDWECYHLFRSYEISIHDLNDISNTFLEEIEKQGYDSMFYASKNYLERLWIYQEYPVWLAHYTDHTSYEGEYVMWQMTSNGRVSGIDGAVDLDILYKEEWKRQF